MTGQPSHIKIKAITVGWDTLFTSTGLKCENNLQRYNNSVLA
jgi:hypothetical protein